MKKLRFMSIVIVAVSVLVSCEKKKVDDFDMSTADFKKAQRTYIEVKTLSSPISDAEVDPFIIPGKNNGGNRTCAEVGISFMGDPEYFAMCGEKIDYNGGFDGSFPDGLVVTVTDGTFVEFSIDGCIEMGDDNYKVGAVIVKGSNDANVYFYPDGATSDFGLAAPINASGGSAGLSNLTFCFVPCDPPQEEEKFIALKVSYWIDTDENGVFGSAGDTYSYGVSTGTILPFEDEVEDSWCKRNDLGLNKFTSPASFFIHQKDNGDLQIATVTVGNGDITVTIKPNCLLDETYLFVGTMAEFMSTVTDGCPDYHSWEIDGTNAQSVTF